MKEAILFQRDRKSNYLDAVAGEKIKIGRELAYVRCFII
jgi:hypothetical protein